ncbi:MAG: dihydrodipicolinate synthase family protein [Planctomycetes bacterium]|nr:dihydrodipicolinate synthase family protein [Planctomycetota bacterium]
MLDLLGLIAAPHTPFDHSGELDLDVVPVQAEHLERNGVAGAFIAGTTGECHSLTVEERERLTEAWVNATQELDVAVIVQVGGNCLPDCKRLARHAERVGADAHAALSPSYFRPSGVDGLVEWCAEIAEAAPSLPFYFYDIPAWTGMQIMTSEFLVLGRKQIPTLAGVKYTNPDLADFLRCARFDGGTKNLYFGNDEALLAGLSLGAIGAVGSTYNFAAPIYHRMAQAFLDGDLATARYEQAMSAALVDLLVHYDYMTAAKTTVEFLGVPVGRPRPPLDALDHSGRQRLKSDLEELGFFEWIEEMPSDPRAIWREVAHRARDGLHRRPVEDDDD